MKKSLPLRVFLVHFLVLGLPLYLATCVFFEYFYLKAVRVARANLKEIVQFRSLAFNSLEPISSEALYDVEIFLSDQKQKIKEQVVELNSTGGSTTLTVLELPITESGQYPLLARQLYGMKEFVSGGGVEEVLSKGMAKFIRYVQIPSSRDPLLLFFLGKVIEKNNKVLGVLLASADIQSQVEKLLTQGDPVDVSLALLNQDGVVLASTDAMLEGQYFDPLTQQVQEQLKGSGALGGLKLAQYPIARDPNGDEGYYDFIFQKKTYLAYRSTEPNLGFSLVAFVPKRDLFILTIQQFIWIYLCYFIVLIVGAVLAYFSSHWLSRPLQELSQVMGQAYDGDLQARFRVQRLGCELNKLGTLFNKTLQALRDNINQAKEERVKKETYLRELEIGRDVQKNLLSVQLPKNDGVEFASIYLQAKEVGGDFYCAEQLESGQIWMAVGDAAGKGISSCLYSLAVRSAIRSYSRIYRDVGQTLCLTNKSFLEQTADSGMFVTTLMGLFDPATSTLVYYSCGHVPGIVKHKDGSLTVLEHSGMALGLIEAEAFNTDRIKLEEGDIVIFYTKGLIEAVNEKNQYFSQIRVKELLQQRKWITAQDVVNGLNTEYQAFIGSTVQEDEVVVLALKIL